MGSEFKFRGSNDRQIEYSKQTRKTGTRGIWGDLFEPELQDETRILKPFTRGQS